MKVTLTPWKRVLIVLFGYAVALAVGILASVLYDRSIPVADMNASGGMYAFGSFTLGFAAFATLALVPTGVLVVSLREYRGVWPVLAVLGFLVSAAGPVSAWFITWTGHLQTRHPELGWVAMVAMLRLTATPFLGLTWTGAAIFARGRFARLLFIACAAIEASLVIRFVVHMAMHWSR
jgi:hypothetical protein